MDRGPDSPLVTESGHEIPPLSFKRSMFLDRSVVVYGPSGTGKTIITKHIMKTLQPHVEQVLVISPSETSNRSYEGFVDQPLIHTRLYMPDPANPKKDDGTKGAFRFLQAIWSRQEMMAAIYTRANQPGVLARLYGRLPRAVRREGLRSIQATNERRLRAAAQVRKRYAAERGRCDEKVKEVNEKYRQMLVLLYKKYIAPAYAALWARDDLSEDERYSLCYLQFNPRLLLIFDDCAAQLKPFFNKEIFRLLFYQNRHSFITVVMCAQDDTDMPTNLRKNAFVSFFTEGIVCTSNFDRVSNKFPKPVKEYVAAVVPDVFQGHRKLAYIREDPQRQHFYYVHVPYPEPFRFGSAAARELCEAVRGSGPAMDKENPYYDRFKL
jgi:ABC-type thiamine transport system ATPase subunit